MNELCRASSNCEGQVAFVLRLPAGQVEFSGLFLTLFKDFFLTFSKLQTLRFYLLYFLSY